MVTSGTVSVRVQARQVVTYDQVVELDRRDYEKLAAMGDAELGETLGSYLNLSDIDDGQEIEIEHYEETTSEEQEGQS